MLTKIKIYGVSISMCVFLLGFNINLSHGQTSIDFLNYTSNNMQFSIQYPSNWKLEEINQPPEVYIKMPGDEFTGSFDITTQKIASYLDTDTMTLKNTSLQQIVQQKLSVPYYSNLIRENEIDIGGNAGWKIEYYNLNSDYKFEINTIDNGKLYTLSYSDDPLKVPETLPLVNKMVKSFRFTE